MADNGPIAHLAADDLTPTEAAALIAALPNGARVAVTVTATRYRTDDPSAAFGAVGDFFRAFGNGTHGDAGGLVGDGTRIGTPGGVETRTEGEER